jgi:hypothetical protein
MTSFLRFAIFGLIGPVSLLATVVHGQTQTQTTDSAVVVQPEKNAPTDSDNRWIFQISPFTQHYSPSPEHKPVRLIGIERLNGNSKFWGGDQSLWGASYFSNSFGQPSGYVYYGGQYNDLFAQERLYFKWTAGVIYGYKPPYENKVPFNRNGWSPGLIAGFGYKITPQWSIQVNALGAAAAMLSFTYELPTNK